MEEYIITLLLGIFASNGLWALLSNLIEKKYSKKDATSRMVLGLGHDKIMHLGTQYLERDEITIDEFENLNKYLYEPYKELGGNGSAERIMEEVKKIKIKSS